MALVSQTGVADAHTAVPMGGMPDVTVMYDYSRPQGGAVLYRSKWGKMITSQEATETLCMLIALFDMNGQLPSAAEAKLGFQTKAL